MNKEVIAANCESSRMSVIDINGVLLLFDIEVKSSGGFGDLKPATAEDGLHLLKDLKGEWPTKRPL